MTLLKARLVCVFYAFTAFGCFALVIAIITAAGR